MATGGKKDENKRELKVMTFGDTNLSFLNALVANVSRVIELVKGANGHQYAIKTDGRGMINIEYDLNDTFTMGLFNNSRWATNLYISPETVKVGNMAEARQSQVNIQHIKQNEVRNVYTTFRVENREDNMLLKQLDVRGHNTSWFSIFSHGPNLLMVRPNGDWLSEKLLYMTDQMSTRAVNNHRRSNGQEVLSSECTAVMRRRQSIAHGSMQKDESVSCSTQTDEPTGRAIELLKNEQVYAQRAAMLHRDWHQLREQKSKYESELAEMRIIESRLTRLREEEKYYTERKHEVEKGLVEVGSAGQELLARRERLQSEKEHFQKEQENFEEMTKPTLVANGTTQTDSPEMTKPTPVTDTTTQTDLPIWTSYYRQTMILSERFTRKNFAHKRVVMNNDGNMTISVRNPIGE